MPSVNDGFNIIHIKEVITMSHKNKESMLKQVSDILGPMFKISTSKHSDKELNVTKDRIYSKNTLKEYIRFTDYFCQYCKKVYNCKTVSDCREHVNDYLKMAIERGDSVSSLKTYASAIGKLYGCSTTEFIDTGIRHRNEITRSRNKVIRDANFSIDNNKKFVDFCKSTGLRRREITMLTGNNLIIKNGKIYLDITKGTKGGRPRKVEVIGDVVNVKRLIESAGEKKVFDRIPNAADIHSYRSEYANALYKKYARTDIPQNDKYVCRNDFKGLVLDKKAMKIVSNNLGHNRISVFPQSYLRK